MSQQQAVGATVVVAHDQGREVGTVTGVQTDPATGQVGWVRVAFPDGTNSAWPVSKVTPWQ